MAKRKLDENDAPTEEPPKSGLSTANSFESLNLEPRLLQAIAKERYPAPTLVQAKAIPIALGGRDILARAKTGSGKTAAYVLPILQSILKRKSQSHKPRGVAALILVPTRELASQVVKAITTFSEFCARDVKVVDLTAPISDQAQKALLASSSDIVVTTPSRASTHLHNSALNLDDLAHLVIDEADLILSYEYGEDLDSIVKSVPKGVQSFLASATLTTDVSLVQELFCKDPIVLDLQDEEKGSSSVSQYVVKCAEDEKFLLTFALFKLKLIKGKCIIFVADVDRCFRLKLFLEQFGIKSCILNSELPLNSRVHVLEEFNKAVYDIIIAADEQQMNDHRSSSALEASLAQENQLTAQKQEAHLIKGAPEVTVTESTSRTDPIPSEVSQGRKPRRMKSSRRDAQYGISRGIDFQAVSCVLNFDFPSNARSYTHRIGRTARAGRTGIAMSFCIPHAAYRQHKALSHPSTANDEIVLDAIAEHEAVKGNKLEPYAFEMAKLEGFKYRVQSALNSVSAGAIREARLRELRQEMLKSEKLKRHLQENPEDERWLRHDEQLRAKSVQAHLKHVPGYLMPGSGGQDIVSTGDRLDVGLKKESENRIRKARERNKMRGRQKRGAGGKKSEPLRTFSVKGKQS